MLLHGGRNYRRKTLTIEAAVFWSYLKNTMDTSVIKTVWPNGKEGDGVVVGWGKRDLSHRGF